MNLRIFLKNLPITVFISRKELKFLTKENQKKKEEKLYSSKMYCAKMNFYLKFLFIVLTFYTARKCTLSFNTSLHFLYYFQLFPRAFLGNAHKIFKMKKCTFSRHQLNSKYFKHILNTSGDIPDSDQQ